MSIALPPERKELGEPLVGNRLSAPAVWREALVIIRRHPVPTVAPALLLGALTETPYLFPDSRSLLQGVLAFLTESFAFYLYVAYAEELSLEARPRRRFIPLPRVLRSLLVAAPCPRRAPGEVETSQAEADLTALEGFLMGNQDLERLDTLLDHFNIFKATGWYW
jgi:hypothetical protein